MAKKKAKEVVEESTASKGEAKVTEKFYKVGVNRFKDKIYADKFAARKGLKVEIVNE